MNSEILFVFFFSFIFLFFIRKIAKRIGLVDRPNYRKRHKGFIPLVGGISIYAGLCCAFVISKTPILHGKLYLFCAGILVFIGALDDRFDISVKIRALVQAVLGILMMIFSGLHLSSFGHIFGDWELKLGPFGYLVTLFAVWASINAFNMVDGIDGLLGSLSCISFGVLGILLYISGDNELSFWCFAMISSTIPYILLNLGMLGQRYKVFMGDAGSTLIGFTALWLLLQSSQGNVPLVSPVTALWIIAIPLMDMVSILYMRLQKRMNPFFPDRQHIHHIIMRAGFTPRQAFILITLAGVFLAGIGVFGEQLSFIPEWFMFILFLLVFFLYNHCIKRFWRFARYIENIKRRMRNSIDNKHVF